MARILVIEDTEPIRNLLVEQLKGRGYDAVGAPDGEAGMEAVSARLPDLVLTDCLMPRLDGLGVLKRLKSDPRTRLIPVVMLTTLKDTETKTKALECGADGFLVKPPDPIILDAQIRNLLKLKAYTDELEHAETVLFSLAEGVEAKDPYTGSHCKRLSAWSALLGEAMGLGPEEVTALRRGGVLHDLGKVGIPDAVLLKPGSLSEVEWIVMREHPLIGERICRPMRSMRLVLPIIRHHHERWDGKGYPDGLKGEEIPKLARIFQVVDAYDALRARRPYKEPFGKEESFRILRREAAEGKWDPAVLEAFLGMMAGTVPLEESYEADFKGG